MGLSSKGNYGITHFKNGESTLENDIISAVWPEWKKVKCINRGSFGVVYEAVRTDHGVESRAATFS